MGQITDSEALENPRSFDVPDEMNVQVVIVHHNGSAVVEGFHTIIEKDSPHELRVFWDSPDGPDPRYTDYHGATITAVEPAE